MADEFSRRKVLGAGATIGTGILAGCGRSGQPDADTASATDAIGSPTESATDERESTAQPGASGVLPARYVVTKEDGEIRAYDGGTLEVAFSGAAGSDDGRVLQETLDATDGGRVFIRRAEYTPDRQLNVDTSHTQVHSDFARLTFQDHPGEPGESQIDFMVGCADEPTEHVEVDGLVLDADKANRTTKTRTADICVAREVTLRNCVIFGGKSVDGGGGYGIGEDDDTDFITIDNCVVRDSDRHGYHPSADHHRIVNSTFVNNAQRTGSVFDLKGSHAVVANNLIEDNGHGVVIDDSGGRAADGRVIVTGNVFVDNYLEDIASGQLEISEASTDSVLVAGNTFVLPDIDAQETSAHVLFDTDGHVGSLELRNNHFEGGGPQALTWFTETGRHVRTLVIEHNTFEAVPRDVGLVASAERLLFRDNLLSAAGDGDARLEIKETSTGVVSGNVTYGASIEVADGLDVVTENNHAF